MSIAPSATHSFQPEQEPVVARSLPRSPISAADARTSGWHLDDLWLPAVVLRGQALEHNVDRFARWCGDHGVDLAPHGKTTMAPQLWSHQLERGAWAITAATVAQARVMHQASVSRVLIANEVVEPAQLRWVGQALGDPDFDILCLVDSVTGVELAEKHLVDAPRPLPVLVELGVGGRRTGIRSNDDALALAERVDASPQLRLAGIEGYEGVLPQRRDDDATTQARQWLAGLAELVVQADSRGYFADTAEVVVTAGGSGYPDLAALALTGLPELSRPVRTVVRSGCYITHDHLSYERTSPLRSAADPDPLRPALSCFARVLSTPESGRSLLGVGKRDVAYDVDLPVPLSVRRGDDTDPIRDRARIVELNDHHGFCDHEPGLLEVGDVVELGLSHPCAVFEKWPLIPVLDNQDNVTDAIRTLF